MEQLPKIVQQRLSAADKAWVHPDPDLLTAFAERSLTERERVQVLQHLADARIAGTLFRWRCRRTLPHLSRV